METKKLVVIMQCKGGKFKIIVAHLTFAPGQQEFLRQELRAAAEMTSSFGSSWVGRYRYITHG